MVGGKRMRIMMKKMGRVVLAVLLVVGTVPLTDALYSGGTAEAASVIVSQNKPATASSIAFDEHPPSNAVDGKTNTGWYGLPPGQPGTDPWWLAVDLGVPAEVDRWFLQYVRGNLIDFELQYSDDGVNYHSIGGNAVVVGQTESDSTSDLTLDAPVTARYFRVLITKTRNNARPGIGEFQLYGTTVPGAPTGVTAAAGDGQATVSFNAPSNDGGSAITSYTVTASPGGATASGASSPIVVTGLTNGTAYTFTVIATNDMGDSAPSAASNSVTPGTVPDAPTNVTAVAGSKQATVSFDPPAYVGFNPVTSYTVTASPGGATASGASSPIVVTGLTNGTTYTFTVTATNAIGESAPSAASNGVTPTSVPDPPTNVVAVPGDGEVTISFDPPADDGGFPITSYTVTADPGGATASGAGSPLVVTGLTNGTAYTFTVVATNALGDSDPSAASNSVTPGTVPDAPTNVTAVAGNGQATVSFDPPAYVGFNPVTSYTVTASPGGATASGAGSPIVVTGLTNGTEYTFTVTATNAFGDSDSSAASNSVTPGTVPDAPTNVVAVAGDGEVTVSFVPPADNGGFSITSYTVTANPGGATASGAGSPIVVTGLDNGTAYTFTVTATNALGDSDSSAASNSVTPGTVPDMPTNVTAVAGNGQATVYFDPPAHDGWNPITLYTVTADPGGATETGAGSPIVVTGLTNGTEYTFTVTATNAIGESASSTESNGVTPGTVPDAPTNVVAVPGDGEVTVSFDPPVHDGWNPITLYTVTASPGGATASGPAGPLTVTGLDNGTTYTFTVIATNAFGDSAPSAASNSVTPGTVPGAPTNVTAVAGVGSATVSFDPPAHDGWSPIKFYTVTASPGGATASGAGGPLTVTGLASGVSYTFTVTATNEFGESEPSEPSNSVTPSSPPSPSPTPAPAVGRIDVAVNGEGKAIATARKTTVENRSVTIVSLDAQQMNDLLEVTDPNPTISISIPVADSADVVASEWDGQTIRNLGEKQATLELQTEYGSYKLPAREINVDELAEKFGGDIHPDEITVIVEIAVADEETVAQVKEAVARGGFELATKPVAFTVKGVHGERTVELDAFEAYVERSIVLPEETDPGAITTAVVVEPDGQVRHVPTRIVIVGGKYHAIINSLTNSTYALIRHEVSYRDMAKHWSLESVNDMGARLVMDGVEPERFGPDLEITRAELADIVIRAIGLKPEDGDPAFRDVSRDDPYAKALYSAYLYGLMAGYDDGTFRPANKATREEAMAVVAKAMEIAGLRLALTAAETERLLLPYHDGDQVSAWARDGVAACVQAEIVIGRSSDQLAPKAYITRAELAHLVRNLLLRASLI